MWRTLAVAIATAIVAQGCAGSEAPTSPSSSLPPSLVFTHAPVDETVITSITPLGNLNPPGHTLPTNHSYLFHGTPGIPVLAPGSGVVQVVSRGSDDSVLVQAATGVSYTLAHLMADAAITNGTSVTGGQRLGVTSALSMAVDLGVTNNAVTLFFVRPERYIPGTIHADSPLKYFQEPLKSALYAKVNRNAADKDGKIDFDRAGRLSGNWFLEGLAAADTENFANGPRHLAFARDVQEPSMVRISIGGSLSMSGAFYVPDGTADPADVTPSSGLVFYRLLTDPLRGGTGVGLLIVQMLDDNRIRIETISGSVTTAAFSEASLIYVR